MRPGAKLAAFGVVLAAAFGGGAAIGAAVGPIDSTGTENPPAVHGDHTAADSPPVHHRVVAPEQR